MLCRVMSLPVSQFSWQWVSDVTLSDIDECTTGVHNCNESATCTNTEGGFTCQCLPDYTGNGTHCRGVTSALWLALSLISHHTLKPGFHSNAIAPANRNAQSKQWQPWLAACQRKCLRFFAVFVYATHATQAIAFEWKPGLTLSNTLVIRRQLSFTRTTLFWVQSFRTFIHIIKFSNFTPNVKFVKFLAHRYTDIKIFPVFLDFQLHTNSGDFACNTAESCICENMAITVGISLIAHLYSEIILFPVWRPPSWIYI